MLEQNNIKMIACKNKIIPGIYITSTPLGNRYDITLRALHLFDKADVMLCEDTRTTKRLFKLLDISLKNKSWLSYNDHNSSNIFTIISNEIRNDKIICLVSDAGTPLISDPGYKLVRFAMKNNIRVYTVPGPCSVISALSISGLKTDQFLFIGFLPKKKGDYIKRIQESYSTKYTLVIFERASRLKFFLSVIKKEFVSFFIVLAKELTKLNEEIITIDINNIDEYLSKKKSYKGEYTVIIEFNEPLIKKRFSDKVLLKELLKLNPSQVSSMLSKKSSESRRNIYKRCIKLKTRNEKNN
tara:strand:- start:246 stop:1139 length:894 start_codon:yes stop_codon:yes gene_type:complete